MKTAWKFEMKGGIGVLTDRDGRRHVVHSKQEASRVLHTIPLSIRDNDVSDEELEVWGKASDAALKSSLPRVTPKET